MLSDGDILFVLSGQTRITEDSSMAATRQRTENWRKCLWQIYERNGAIEISLPESQEAVDGGDVLIVRITR